MVCGAPGLGKSTILRDAVRDKLLPFFIGAFASCLLCVLLFTFLNARAYLSGSPDFASFLP